MYGHRVVDVDRLVLADPVGTIGALVLDGGIPPAGEVDDVIGGGQGQANPACFRREDQDIEPGLFGLEMIDIILACRTGYAAMDTLGPFGQAEMFLDSTGQKALHFQAFQENQGFFVLGLHLGEDFKRARQPRAFGGIGGDVGTADIGAPRVK